MIFSYLEVQASAFKFDSTLKLLGPSGPFGYNRKMLSKAVYRLAKPADTLLPDKLYASRDGLVYKPIGGDYIVTVI